MISPVFLIFRIVWSTFFAYHFIVIIIIIVGVVYEVIETSKND